MRITVRSLLILGLLLLAPKVFAQKSSSKSPHGAALNIPCENCHSAQAWRPIRTIPEFDHNKTSYPLRGLHEKVKCVECHVKPVFTDVGKNCADCHADIHLRRLGSDCAQCHTVLGWQVSVNQIRDHQNRFPLLGAHAAVQCDECHKGAAVGRYEGLSTECVSCHLTDYQKTNNPPHLANTAVFSTTCNMCHSFDSWLNAKFDHTTTGFLLTQGHANVPCLSCHIGNNYHLMIAPTDCGNSGCHLTTWQQTNNPPHTSAGAIFAAANCSNCHTTATWNTATFDHSTTGFPLTQGHANVACTACHLNNNYNLQIAPTACGTSGCHLTTWQKTTTPVHSTSGPAFAVGNCANCHTTAGWDAASFDHSVTGFPLVGTHLTTPCAQCHVNNNYSLTSGDCLGCHQAAWQSTTTLGGTVPNHITAGFPSTASACSSCHPITKWADGKFDHSTTGFPLTNGHASVQCALCHINNNYALQIQPTDCGNAQCHLTTWQGTNNPVHSTAGALFAASNCANCHTTAGWNTAAAFDHSTTGFPLTQLHAQVPCASCHINNNYTLMIQPTDCGNAQCHLKDYQGTNNPVHSTAGPAFAIGNCSNCHTPAGWDTVAAFDHSTTGFALVGTHLSTPCAQCHVNNNYTLSSADCYGCHSAAFMSTTTIGGNVPNHVAAGFPTTAVQCASCHPITTWSAGVFDHSTTGFPLTGLHTSVQCSACHINGNYTLQIAPTACGNAQCHLTTWQGTNNPTHSSAGTLFAAANCSNCHTTAGWTTSTFDHSTTGFALVGTHLTTPCAQCHVNNNYSLTSADCYGCHAAAFMSTTTIGGNVPNHVAAGFPTTAAQCASCHPITTWSAGMFDHSTTGFPLTGAHANPSIAPCNSCHVNNNYSGNLPTDCYSCHIAAYQSTQTLGGGVPNHVSAGFPTTCTDAGCHTTASWLGATFNHTYWQLPHHSAVCSDCHLDSTNYATESCINCHTQSAHSMASTNSIHKGKPGYSYGPMTCIASGCHPKGAGGG